MSRNIVRSLLLLVALTLPCVPARANIIPIAEVFEPTGQWDSKKFVKVAVLQWNREENTPLKVSVTEAEAFKQQSRETIAEYVRQAAKKGAEMVVTPEFSIVGYPVHPEIPPAEDNFQSREEVAPYVETVPGPSSKYFGKLAKELGIYLHIGIVEVDKKTNLYYNTVVALAPDGKVVAKYRKIHLFGVEPKFLASGTEPVIYPSRLGKVGIVICSDIYSPHPMDQYKGKVDLLALSTSWAAWNSGMQAFQAGARWVNAYVLAGNQYYFPDSGVVNPNGTTQSHIRQSVGLAYGYLPRK